MTKFPVVLFEEGDRRLVLNPGEYPSVGYSDPASQTNAPGGHVFTHSVGTREDVEAKLRLANITGPAYEAAMVTLAALDWLPPK